MFAETLESPPSPSKLMLQITPILRRGQKRPVVTSAIDSSDSPRFSNIAVTPQLLSSTAPEEPEELDPAPGGSAPMETESLVTPQFLSSATPEEMTIAPGGPAHSPVKPQSFSSTTPEGTTLAPGGSGIGKPLDEIVNDVDNGRSKTTAGTIVNDVDSGRSLEPTAAFSITNDCASAPTVLTDDSAGSDRSTKSDRYRANLLATSDRWTSPLIPDDIGWESDDDSTASNLSMESQVSRGSLRNESRVIERDLQDRATLGKYLPSDVHLFVPPPAIAPSEDFLPPKSFTDAIKSVFHSPTMAPKRAPIAFSTDPAALQHNSSLLAQHNFDLSSLYHACPGTTLDYGSEFRPIESIRRIFHGHPLISKLQAIITQGMDYFFSRELSDHERANEVTAILAQGNHKSATENRPQMLQLLRKEVLHGFSIPIPRGIVPKIKNVMVQPLGMVVQTTITPSGERVPKLRYTQDLSFSATLDDASVNSRIDISKYAEMVYGYCLSRILHWIVSLRRDFPSTRILIAKYDYSDAYRRMAHSATAAAQSVAVFEDIAYIATRLTFGGSPNPAAFCTLSEMIADFANELARSPHFDPSDFTLPETASLDPLPNEDTTTPFAAAAPMTVFIPTNAKALVDAFIDDLVAIFLESERNNRVMQHVVPVGIHCTSRPLHPTDEPLPRRSNLSQSKLQAEGRPQEQQIVLGWFLDTRRLQVQLPDDKYLAWTNDLTTIIRDRRCTFEQLESTVGRLNHASFVIPLARHYLDSLRRHLQPRKRKSHIVTLGSPDRRVLKLWIKFLTTANRGISMNRLVLRQPSRIGWSDSCPFGLGGFDLHSGFAWRLKIPRDSPLFGLQMANNPLEFLAMVINLWVQLLENPGSDSQCLLALGDNTSAIGWLYKTSFIKPDSAYYDVVHMIAEKLAELFLDTPHCLASQHFPGELNDVADLLSYHGSIRNKRHPLAWDNPPDDILTTRFHFAMSQLIPQSFRISRLPDEILSWTVRVLQTAELSLNPNRKPPTNPRTEPGDATVTGATTQASAITISSITFPTTSKNFLHGASLDSIGLPLGTQQDSLLGNVRNQWHLARSKIPLAIWHRNSGQLTANLPSTSLAVPTSCPP
jgi:hypothetical protein